MGCKPIKKGPDRCRPIKKGSDRCKPINLAMMVAGQSKQRIPQGTRKQKLINILVSWWYYRLFTLACFKVKTERTVTLGKRLKKGKIV